MIRDIRRIVFLQNKDPYNGRIFGDELQEELYHICIIEKRNTLEGLFEDIRHQRKQ